MPIAVPAESTVCGSSPSDGKNGGGGTPPPPALVLTLFSVVYIKYADKLVLDWAHEWCKLSPSVVTGESVLVHILAVSALVKEH